MEKSYQKLLVAPPAWLLYAQSCHYGRRSALVYIQTKKATHTHLRPAAAARIDYSFPVESDTEGGAGS